MSRLAPVWTEVLGQSDDAVEKLYQDGLEAQWVIPRARTLIADLAVARTNRHDGQAQLRQPQVFWTVVLSAAARGDSDLRIRRDDRDVDELAFIEAPLFAADAVSGLGVIGARTEQPRWRGELGNLAARTCRIVGGGLSDVSASKLGFWACSLVRFSIKDTTARIVDLSDARIAGVPRSPARLQVTLESPDATFRAQSTLMRFVEITIDAGGSPVDFADSDLSSRRHPDSDDLMALAAPGRKPRRGGAVRFKDCVLPGASFEDCWLEGVVFDHCKLSHATFRGAKFDSASHILPTCTYDGIVLPNTYPGTLLPSKGA